MVAKKTKPGPKPTGKALTGRATAVCSQAELAAFNAAAESANIRLSSWMRQAALAALPNDVQDRLKQQ
jgi:hypothetical protein